MSETTPTADPFEALLKRYYGGHRHHRHHRHAMPYGHGRHLADAYRTAQVDERAERLLASYYGRHRHSRHRGDADRKMPVAVSVSMDDGETLEPAIGEEYVVETAVGEADFEEYVVERPGISGEASLSETSAAHDVDPRDEYGLDIADPLGTPKATDCACHAPAPGLPAPVAGVAQSLPSAPLLPDPDAPPPLEDDFISDMQAILSRQKVFDPVTKKTVEPDKLAKTATVDPAPEQGEPANNSQAIFDQIAQSMQYANKYDLGTVELENRFADFDRISDLEQQANARKRIAAADKPAAATTMAVDSQDFIQDLDTMQHQRGALATQGTDGDGDPFAFVPPPPQDPAAADIMRDGMAPATAGPGTQPADAPSAAIPAIQLPSIPIPTIQVPGMPVSASLSGSTAAALSPFPARFANPLTADDQKLTHSFNDALAAVKHNPDFDDLPNVDDLPIIMVALNDDKTRPSVGRHVGNMFYVGSMAKIAAMYAAFQLRQAVNQLAATLTPAMVGDAAKFFAAVRKAFDDEILKAADLIKKESTGGNRAPQYEKIFTAAQGVTGKWSVEFRSDFDPKFDFAGHLRKMVVDSHNPSAGFCIQALGFSWINGLMQKAGLFNPSSKHGIWLAGDYLDTKAKIDAAHGDIHNGDTDLKEEFDLRISGWREVRIPSENDGPSKQATTCIDAAHLFVLLFDGKLMASPAANQEMLGLLHDAVAGGGAPSIVGRFPLTSPAPFPILQSKIGVGTLGSSGNCNADKTTHHTKGCVLAESMIVRQAAVPQREFVVVWQNVKDAANQDFKQIARIRDIIQKTMDGYP